MNKSNQLSALIDLVDYQTNAIVSSTIIKKKAGTVTLFALDAEQALSEHTAPFDALVQIVDGMLEVKVGAQLFALGVANTLILPAGIPHALRALEPTKMLLTMIKSD